jgi:hypothetical protein
MWNSPTPAGERPEFVGPKGNMAHLVVRNGQFRPSRALVVVDERHQTSKRASSGKQRLVVISDPRPSRTGRIDIRPDDVQHGFRWRPSFLFSYTSRFYFWRKINQLRL